MSDDKIKLNVREYAFTQGETVLDVAARHDIYIPTLCHDPRLDPAGACRTCLVEIDGWGRLPPACATVATAGMDITTENPRIDRHRKTLLGLYMTDHPGTREEAEPGARNDLFDMAVKYEAPTDWGYMEPVRSARPDDRNPYVNFDPDLC
ncbi:MAG TPA: 2Fe-2S iron-sulfur cluster-binding protein, partial [Dehalococcoidia bacterium]|nr:2Fe-2S iron-sulfur cluster-binding protein [Dehalococcoidia bacterium]